MPGTDADLQPDELAAYDDAGYDANTYEQSNYDGGDVGLDTGETATGWNDVTEWDAGTGVDSSGVELDFGEETAPGVDEAVVSLFEGIVNIL